nr:hypothetical protein [uncultured Flavobacterium sp.]
MKKIGNFTTILTTIIKYAGVAVAVFNTLKYFQEQLTNQGLIINKEIEDADISK